MVNVSDLFNAVILVLIVVALMLYLYARTSQRARMGARLVSEVQRRGVQPGRGEAQPISAGVLAGLRRLGAWVPLLNSAQRAEASGKLVAAGYRTVQAVLVLTGLTLLSIIACAGLTAWLAGPYLEAHGTMVWAGALLAAAYIGSLLPRLVLDRLVSRRQEAIRLSLPDALDLLVICTNAGLALNGALERVADEMETVAPELSDELKLTAMELRLSSDIERVLSDLAERTRIEGMRTLVGTFLQARQYGTAITQALRILAKTERTARMMRLEEAAAKLSVKMTLPMMLFILPTVLMVAVGPAMLSLMKTFSQF